MQGISTFTKFFQKYKKKIYKALKSRIALVWQPGCPVTCLHVGPVAFRPHLTMSLANCCSVLWYFTVEIYFAKSVPENNWSCNWKYSFIYKCL